MAIPDVCILYFHYEKLSLQAWYRSRRPGRIFKHANITIKQRQRAIGQMVRWNCLRYYGLPYHCKSCPYNYCAAVESFPKFPFHCRISSKFHLFFMLLVYLMAHGLWNIFGTYKREYQRLVCYLHDRNISIEALSGHPPTNWQLTSSAQALRLPRTAAQP